MGAQCEKFTVRIQGELGVDQSAAPLFVGQQAFGAVGNPFDRPFNDFRRPQRQAVFGIATALDTEPAAHLVADDPQFGLRHSEYLVADLSPDAVDGLDRCAQIVAVLVGIVEGYAAAGFHRVAGDAVDADAVADDMRSAGERGSDRRRIAALVHERLVSRIVFPDRDCARRQRIVDRDDRGQRRVVHVDQLGRVYRLVQRFGHDKRHRLADEADAALGEQRLYADEPGRAVAPFAGHRRTQRAEPALFELRSCQYRQHTGRRARGGRVDRGDVGMGVRRAQHIGTGLALRVDVVGVAPAAAQQTKIFVAYYRIADAIAVHVWLVP